MLTRQSISSGIYLESFETLPDNVRWSLERIERSLAETMLARPHSGDVWVFGYGSLIWNPLLNFKGRQPATLQGWHRSFCIGMIAGRATPQAPGRMLALEPGGTTQGVAFRLCEVTADEELLLLWIREMPTGAYRPTWATIILADGSEAMAIAFVADPSFVLYEQDSSVASVAACIAAASGTHGSNADYVFKLESALADGGETDTYIQALADELKRLAPPQAPLKNRNCSMLIEAINTVQIHGIQGQSDAIGELLASKVDVLRGLSGCLSYTVTRSHFSTDLWIVSGHWESRSAMEAHFNHSALQDFIALLTCSTIKSIDFNSFFALQADDARA